MELGLFGQVDLPQLIPESTPKLRGNFVVRNEEPVVVGQRDQVALEQPMDRARQRETVLDDIRSASLNRPNVRRLNLGLAGEGPGTPLRMARAIGQDD